MHCPLCARPMRALFVTMVCDFCDGLATEAEWDRGWVVWRGRPMPADEYVFSNPDDAERWRSIQGLDGCPVKEVRAPVKFTWRLSNGSVKGLEMAEHPVTIYADRRFPAAPNRAFLTDALAP